MTLDLSFLGLTASPRPKFVPEEVDWFLVNRAVNNCSETTIATYESRLTIFFSFMHKEDFPTDIKSITKRHLERFFLRLRAIKRASSYIHDLFRALRAFFNWCVVEGFIDHSPMRGMKEPQKAKILRARIHEKHLDQLLQLCPNNTFLGARNAAVVWLFWSTGMRKTELATLQTSDFDFHSGRIKVWGKGARERYVPITKGAKSALVRYFRHRKEYDNQELWLTEERRPAKPAGLDSAMERLFERAGLRKEFPGDLHHIFRRSWAKRMIKKGKSLKMIQIVGGWQNMRTLELYLHELDSEDALEEDWE